MFSKTRMYLPEEERMSLITIDHTACRRDSICIHVCPLRLFETDSEGFPVLRPDADRKCIACGHCVAVCPVSAVHHQSLPLEESPVIDQTLAVSPTDLNQLFRTRRSVREFRTEPVPRELVHEAIEVARWAPSAVNRQPVHWLVIQNPEEVRQLAGLVIDFLRKRSEQEPQYAPYVRLWEEGKDPVLRNAPHLIVVHAPDDWTWSGVDCAIALTQFELAAVARGIGTCWGGFLMRAASGHAPVRERLAIPAGHSVQGALMYGFPLYRYQRIPPRQEARVVWR
jgi:nitroreductase/NAD-dependent dihydropyrimidine dehydrogenase PreA subunit